MNKTYRINQILKFAFIIIAIIIVTGSTIFTNRLAKKLSVEETKKIEIWAEATRQLILADEATNTNFILMIIEGNTTIPVIMTDENDNMLSYRNMSFMGKSENKYFAEKIRALKTKHEPIVVRLDDEQIQYIYYDDSLLLKQLYIFPYIQFGVIITFILVAYFAFSSTKRAEQNRVWVGLSKETAHQLGTPISSLLAWTELLRSKYPEDKLVLDMGKDVNRLRIIAERFSKIGSKPDIKQVKLYDTMENAINYMRGRSSNKVDIGFDFQMERNIKVALNVPLFEWVIENLCKNAIDAMNGSGKINITVIQKENHVNIDISDTGKGMERKMYKAIFSPGFTTKERGWGLGLSLAKRIIGEYHRGKIFVKDSEINTGTTFRIILPEE
ncbi:MAG: sensor histidine kinase [Paludibacteraceae bacterium]